MTIEQFFRDHCNTCGSRMTCNGCSNCGACDRGYIKEMVNCDHGTSASTCCLEEAFVALPNDLFFFCEHNVWF